MTDYDDLEISLSRRYADNFTVKMRFSQPDDQVDQPPERDEEVNTFTGSQSPVLALAYDDSGDRPIWSFVPGSRGGRIDR
jgi:hypothetical protein